jgi:hypothetical protein
MAEKDPIRIFVLHDIAENEEYSRVYEYLGSRDNFFYANRSIPETLLQADSLEVHEDELRNQIKRSEMLIYPLGGLKDNASLVRFQLTVVPSFGKPILVISSFGATIAMSKELIDIATDMVDWNDRIITDAARKTASARKSHRLIRPRYNDIVSLWLLPLIGFSSIALPPAHRSRWQ